MVIGIDDIAAGASIISSIGGLFGGKSKAPNPADLINNQLLLDRKRPAALVEGAKEAGLHPLAVLGMGGMSAPVAQFGGDDGQSSWGRALEGIGQGVSRAASIYQSQGDKVIQRTSQKLQLENMDLQNDRLRSEIALMNHTQNPSLSNPTMEGSAGPYDHAAIDAELRGQPDFYFHGNKFWSPHILNQMESDYVRVPIEYLRAAGRDFKTFGNRVGENLRSFFTSR